ncbi:MAG: efflux RND transporter periplasmic adaptor subunit [Pseudomonadota bacterium]
MKKLLSPALIAWFLLLAACSQGNQESAEDAGESTADTTAAEEDAAEEPEDAAPAVPVETAYPDRGTVYALYSGTAPIEALAEATVIARVGGEIRSLVAEEGDLVTEGQELARLDGDRLALELNESRARVEKLQRDFQRNVELKEKGLISDGDFDQLKFEMEALEASYNLARLELDYTQIRAPIAGVISERIARLGNTVAVGDPLFRVTSFDPLVAYLYVPEREYRRIQPGKPVGIQIDALGDTLITASVTRVSPVVDPETGTFKITVEVSDTEQRIKPGMFARLGIVYDTRENVLRIPRSALQDNDDETYVFVVEDGLAQRKVIETGYSDRGMVEVVAGLNDDAQVVTVGQVGLKDDTRVDVINTAANAPLEVSSDARID